MVKSIFLSAALVVGFSVLNAQTGKKVSLVKNQKLNTIAIQDEGHKHSTGSHRCGTDEAMNALFAKDPEAKARYEAAQKAMGAWENDPSANKIIGQNSVMSDPPSPMDTIPVVFHILHQNGGENVSNQVIYDVINQLNIDYQKLDPDTSTIEPFFQARATGCNLTFMLATKDPLGNCTNGIIRHYDANTVWDQTSSSPAYTGTTSGKWDPRKYMNIYLVKSITDGGGGGGGTIVGYTYRPGTWPSGNANDCIIYNSSFLDIPSKEVRSLAHEIGHWLNLAHTFGSTNQPGVSCGNDNLGNVPPYGAIDDTPITLGFFSTCPAATPNSCDASNYANVENIMDYSSCPKMFTLGQCRRMRYTLTLTTSGRSTLVSSTNKINTGIRVQQVCAPVADFGADKRYACTGANVTFADSTQNAVATSWNWDFPGGTPSTSIDENPVVTYATPGVYAVTYTATNSAGSNTITKAGYITVYSSTATNQTALVESFESITVPNADWTVDNTNGGPGWAQTGTAALTGTQSMMINNFTNTTSAVETFYTPSYNIAAINAATPGVTFTFKLSHQRKTTTASERLQVYSSINCGQTWTQRYNKAGSALANVTGANTSAFVPTLSTQWRTETVAISAVQAQTNVMFKFVFTSDDSGESNNIYIDDINMSNNGVGIIEHLENQLNYTVFPNPNNGNMHVSFDLTEKHSVKLELVDLLGKTLETAVNSNLNVGSYNYAFGANQKLASGIYFAKLTIDGNSIIRKIIVE
ncbi:MAG: M43 family zinc metalloprotease [Bacteroidota bacterium]|nr:M43 family zinc metalloprotease [Bacteroidota bacterium]